MLGGGSSGEHFVGALRRFDTESRITLVERRLVGGECSYWACMPTKTMLRAPELLAAARHSDGAITGAELDPAGIWHWRDQVAEQDDSSQVEWLDLAARPSSSAATPSSPSRASFRSATVRSPTTGS